MEHIGTIKNENNTQEVYATWDGTQVKYIVDGYEVAVYDPEIMEEPILFMNNTKANELSGQAREQMEVLAENVDVEKIQQKSNEYKQNIADGLGIEKGYIRSITEIDPKQKVKTISDEEYKKREKTSKNKQNKQQEKEETHTIKDINIKQEARMDAMATDWKSIESVLKRAGKMPQIEGKNFYKLGVVESTSMDDIGGKVNNTRFNFVAIATDGTVVPMDLEEDRQEGNNPTEISYRTNADGTVEQDDVLSRYKIGDSGETFSVKFSNGPGYIELGYSPNKTQGGDGIEGNVSMDTQIETRNVRWAESLEVKADEYGGGIFRADNAYQEAKTEGKTDKPGLKEGRKGIATDATYKDADGRDYTKSHEHIADVDIEKLAEEIMKDENVAEVFTKREIEKRLKEAQQKGKNLNQEKEEIETDADYLDRTDRSGH